MSIPGPQEFRCTGCKQKLDLNREIYRTTGNKRKCVFCEAHSIPYELIPLPPKVVKKPGRGNIPR